MTVGFVRVTQIAPDAASLRFAFAVGLAWAVCSAAHAGEPKRSAPPPRPAPQVNAGARPPGGVGAGRPGVHIPGGASGGGQGAASGGGAGIAGRGPAGSPSVHLPSSVQPHPAPAVPAVRPATSSRPNTPADSHPVTRAPGAPQNRPGSRTQGAPQGHPQTAAGAHQGKPAAGRPTEQAGGAKAHGPETPSGRADLTKNGVASEHEPQHSGAEAGAVSARVPPGRRAPDYPGIDRHPAVERAALAGRAHDFHTHDVRAFTAGEHARWAHGGWHDEWHYGRRGWWWQVDGVWYPYDVPVYPYPEVVDAPEVYAAPVFDDGAGASSSLVPPPPQDLPPAVAGLGSPLTGDDGLSIPRLPAAQQVATHCNDPDGDYPDVRRCTQPWVTR